MQEADIEKYFRKQVKKSGGIAKKFVSPGWRGAPDRIVLFPKGIIAFVEIKAPGEKPRKQQKYRIKEIRSYGQKAAWLDTKKAVDEFIEEVLKQDGVHTT